MFTKGVDYVEFKGVQADKDGHLKITLDPSSGEIGIFNGFQLRGELPPPTAQSQQQDWAVKLWLKADDLAREGLKPGEPVAQWKDASWGIRFSPDSKPPHSDMTPIYAEVNVPGNPKPVPAVLFDGASSLRQLDVLDVVDQDITAFVVYWPEEDGVSTWKELYAKRHGAMCIYAGGIATARNAILCYTPYRENGICLGANDTLPLVLTGHQNEYDPGERFKGYIAEVIVFAKAFGTEDQLYETVESYLQEKYFRAPGNATISQEVPWYQDESADIGKQTKTINKPAEKDILPKDIDNRISVNQVSVFSLTNQQNPSKTEYAAGEVVLPFSYSASVSTAPRPPCLDFPGQPNPDCCHVFVRIDGELWMFRIDWIAEKGRCARYRGPDIDHMT